MASFYSVAINFVLNTPRELFVIFTLNDFTLRNGFQYGNQISFQIKRSNSGIPDPINDPNLQINTTPVNFTSISSTPILTDCLPVQLIVRGWSTTTNVVSFFIENQSGTNISEQTTTFTIKLLPTDNIPDPSPGVYYVIATIQGFSSQTSNSIAFCLYKDTTVLTPFGFKPVYELKQNDYVITHDYRHSKIQRIYRSLHLPNPDFLPIKIPKGFFYENYPPNDCYLSKWHLVFVKGKWFVPNQNMDILSQLQLKENVEYYHIELENYPTDNLVINGGCIVESLCNEGNKKERDQGLYKERTKPENSYLLLSLKNKEYIPLEKNKNQIKKPIRRNNKI